MKNGSSETFLEANLFALCRRSAVRTVEVLGVSPTGETSLELLLTLVFYGTNRHTTYKILL